MGARAASKGAGRERRYTYVGIDAHKKDLFIAMQTGTEPTPVTWRPANEPNAVRRLVRKLDREAPAPVGVFL